MPVLRKIHVFNLTEQSALLQPEHAETKHSCLRGQHRGLEVYFSRGEKIKLVWTFTLLKERMYYFKTLHICPGSWTMEFLKAYHFSLTSLSEVLDTSQKNLKVSSGLKCLLFIFLKVEQVMLNSVQSGERHTFLYFIPECWFRTGFTENFSKCSPCFAPWMHEASKRGVDLIQFTPKNLSY